MVPHMQDTQTHRGQTIRRADTPGGGLVIEWSSGNARKLGYDRTYGFANGGHELAAEHIDRILS